MSTMRRPVVETQGDLPGAGIRGMRAYRNQETTASVVEAVRKQVPAAQYDES